MSITKSLEIINKKEFLVAALDDYNKIFIKDIVTLVKPAIMSIYFSYEAQVTLLISVNIFFKYFKFSKIFFLYSMAELLKSTRINNYSINLFDNR